MRTANVNLQFLEAQINKYLHNHYVDDDLYVEYEGFRFPFAKTKANLTENMRFLQVQFEKYQHEHTSTNIQFTGFRFPYLRWDTDQAIKENVKFLERQLDEYLHDHCEDTEEVET